jgi:hypothetical protein
LNVKLNPERENTVWRIEQLGAEGTDLLTARTRFPPPDVDAAGERTKVADQVEFKPAKKQKKAKAEKTKVAGKKAISTKDSSSNMQAKESGSAVGSTANISATASSTLEPKLVIAGRRQCEGKQGTEIKYLVVSDDVQRARNTWSTRAELQSNYTELLKVVEQLGW